MAATDSMPLCGLLNPASERGPAPGELVDGRYRIGTALGRGGMGIVFEARDVWLDRAVAIKLIDPWRITPAAFERFQKEARALARIRHGNVLLRPRSRSRTSSVAASSSPPSHAKARRS